MEENVISTGAGALIELPHEPPERQREMPIHSLCALFPPLHRDELEALAEDIIRLGQLEPIVTYEGAILDGRNRYEARLLAGVEPDIGDYIGTDPLGFVIAKTSPGDTSPPLSAP
jgi:hypothetical protein